MEKVDYNLISKLTLEEKAALVSGKNFWFTDEISRLKIPKMMVTDGPSGLRKQADSSDALGLSKSVQAINFPASCLTSASFDKKMLEKLGENLGQAAKAEQIGVLLGPGVNIKRSPLAGRNFEYFSEDPMLAGELASSYVKGVQSQGVGVSVKHFAGNNRENQRFTSSSNIDQRALREVYLAVFERIVKKARPATLMCSYNKLNGILNSQNKKLLTDILRNQWGFSGLVMSDWGAVADHVAALKAGLDLEMPGKGEESTNEIVSAVKDGRLDEGTLNNSVLRVLKLVEKYHSKQKTVVSYDKQKQHNFARKLADDSIVLLKNQNHILPIKEKDSLAIIGGLAKTPRYQGGGSSHVNAYKVISPLQAISKNHANTAFSLGYSLDADQEDAGQEDLKKENRALNLAKKKDKVIFFAGFRQDQESEGFDKTTMELPDNQNKLIKKLLTVNKKVIVVLQNGSSVLMPWQDQVSAILETYLAGEAVGEATWDILSGSVNPSGKLPETFPLRLEDNPTYLSFNVDPKKEDYREGTFVGYRYYDKKKISAAFPFGFGLSYTNFSFSGLSIKEVEGKLQGSVKVKNTGLIPGAEVVQVYGQNLASKVAMPKHFLVSFGKVTLSSGQTKSFAFTISKRNLSWYNSKTKSWQFDNGKYTIFVGNSSRNLVLSKNLTLNWSPKGKAHISPDTYLSEITKPEYKNALSDSGLLKVISNLTSDPANRKMMQNTPLRSLGMMNVKSEQIKKFIKLANQ